MHLYEVLDKSSVRQCNIYINENLDVSIVDKGAMSFAYESSLNYQT